MIFTVEDDSSKTETIDKLQEKYLITDCTMKRLHYFQKL